MPKTTEFGTEFFPGRSLEDQVATFSEHSSLILKIMQHLNIEGDTFDYVVGPYHHEGVHTFHVPEGQILFGFKRNHPRFPYMVVSYSVVDGQPVVREYIPHADPLDSIEYDPAE